MAIGQGITPTTQALPESYDLRSAYPSVPRRLFLNHVLGTCVMACRGDTTMFFELVERGRLIIPTDAEIRAQYFRESGGVDRGLSLVSSLGEWQSNGWMVGGKRLKIKAKYKIPVASYDLIRQAIVDPQYMGVAASLDLPLSAADQFRAGSTWSVTTGSRAKALTWGRHCVHLTAFTAVLLGCDTWARRVWMTRAFWTKYGREAYAVVDAVNT